MGKDELKTTTTTKKKKTIGKIKHLISIRLHHPEECTYFLYHNKCKYVTKLSWSLSTTKYINISKYYLHLKLVAFCILRRLKNRKKKYVNNKLRSCHCALNVWNFVFSVKINACSNSSHTFFSVRLCLITKFCVTGHKNSQNHVTILFNNPHRGITYLHPIRFYM